MTFRNPIISGFHPDPSVCRVGEDYYLVTSSFEYFPGVPIFHSRDLVHWTQIGHCLTRESQLPLANTGSSGGIFAPALRFIGNRFYMVTTNVSQGGNFYVHASDPAGDWSDPIWVAQGGIDPSLFADDDGTVYFTSSGGAETPGIAQSVIDLATGELLTKPQAIWKGTGGKYAEAPHLYKIDGRYYLMIAEGGTEMGHMETIARAGNPWGPFESCPHNPILTHRNREAYTMQSTGHADLVQAHDGSWWAVFLATRVSAGYPHVHHLGRETFLSPVTWDEDGWPVIGNHGTVDLVMGAPAFAQKTETAGTAVTVRDDFDGEHLDMVWNFRGNPDPTLWSLNSQSDSLTLACDSKTLNDTTGLAFLGRRQQHFTMRAATRLDLQSTQNGDEAGLTVLIHENFHYEVYVTVAEAGRSIGVRRRIGDLAAVVASEPIHNGAVTLWITSEPDLYRLGYQDANGENHELASGSTRFLSTEIAGGFTGVFIGLYATSNGAFSEGTAYFDWFEYTA